MIIRKNCYSITFDENTGRVLSIFDNKNPLANWISTSCESAFGIPFVNGTQWGENNIPCSVISCSDTSAKIESHDRAINLNYVFDEQEFSCSLNTVIGCGPRAGLQLDWNLLDMPNSCTEYQCMPHVIYTDSEYEYAYFIFATADKRYVAVTVEGFAAWRIKYSYPGHRMIGFQILTQADDVLVGNKKPLFNSNLLTLHFFFGDSEKACIKWIASKLKIGIALPNISGGIKNNRISIKTAGECQKIYIIFPDQTTTELTGTILQLKDEGLYKIVTLSESRKHISTVQCHENWEILFNKINSFYKNHFQDESGAFYRVIWSDTLTPEGGITLEGTAFGDINALYSCRSGEFGGFAAWAMMKNILLFGGDPEIRKAVDHYVINWVLNRGHEDTPYNGSICKRSQQYLGREYGPYHLYHEINVPQHEAFFMEQLVDYYMITGDHTIMIDAWKLAEHFITEHMNSDGMVVCQNLPKSKGTDYCTVHTPICALLKVADLISAEEPEKSMWIKNHAEKLADYVCQRGFSFPTEGEACTEDGSLSCSVITLLNAYQHISPKPEYLDMAKKLLDYHEVLVLRGEDCRQRNSSLRFWETQYESRDWGPSINAGHAWTIWYAEAKALMAQITGSCKYLQDAYEGFITNICKVQTNGAMPSCYTPDMIPGLPHKPCVWGGPSISTDVTELRMTSTYLAMDYVKKTYACSGNYFLIKAAEIWDHISGIDIENAIAINGILSENRFESAAERFDCLIIGGQINKVLCISCKPGIKIHIIFENHPENLTILGAYSTWPENHFLELVPFEKEIILQ